MDTDELHFRRSARRNLGTLAAVGALSAVVLVAPAARADDASSEAAAQALFDQARELMAKKDYAHACPKFAASQHLDPGAGTLLDLADCYEKNGQTASAWASYKDAASAAQVSGRKDWEKQATTAAARLAPKLSRLTVHAPPTGASGLTVKRDGEPMTSEELDLALPVDPGPHAIDAEATGKTPFHADVTVGAISDAQEVKIPALADAPGGAAPAPLAPASATTPATNGAGAASDQASSDGSGLRTAGYIVGAVGAAGLIVGIVGGLASISKNSSAKNICPNAGLCSSHAAVDDASSAHSWGNVATVGFVAGGALLAGGLALVVFSPHAHVSDAPATASLRVSPWLTGARDGAVGGAGLGLGGRF